MRWNHTTGGPVDSGALTAIFHLIIWKTPLLYVLYELSRICKPYVAYQSRNLGQFLTVRTFSIDFPCKLLFPLPLSHKNISFRSCPQGRKLE